MQRGYYVVDTEIYHSRLDVMDIDIRNEAWLIGVYDWEGDNEEKQYWLSDPLNYRRKERVKENGACTGGTTIK